MNEALHIIQEVVQIAKAEEINNTDNLVSDVIEALKTMLPDGKTSMLQDIEANRKTEIDIFAGTIIKLGKKHNIPTPYNNKILIKINNLENK